MRHIVLIIEQKEDNSLNDIITALEEMYEDRMNGKLKYINIFEEGDIINWRKDTTHSNLIHYGINEDETIEEIEETDL